LSKTTSILLTREFTFSFTQSVPTVPKEFTCTPISLQNLLETAAGKLTAISGSS